MCRYYHAIGEKDAAELRLSMLKQIEPYHPVTQQAKILLKGSDSNKFIDALLKSSRMIQSKKQTRKKKSSGFKA
jgi:hypothetical protein